MIEVELKLLLDPAQERALRNSPVVRALSEGRARTETLHSIYYDTEVGALRSEGIALRLRRVGRKWVQTVKRANGAMINGLSSPEEIEFPVRGQTLTLNRIVDDDLRETLLGLAQKGLRPALETRFRRTRRILSLPNGARIEMAIDKGELVAGSDVAPLAEVEFELLEGSPTDLYSVAAEVFTLAPVRFAQTSKSERALSIGQPAKADAPRKARKLVLSGTQTVEQAAMDVLREGLAHCMPNLADLLERDVLTGPHQTRVALRRMRSALTAFQAALGKRAVAPWSETARWIAAETGRLRDLDVLVDQLAPRALPTEDTASERLLFALQGRREAVRVEIRKTLSGEDVTRFVFGFAGFLAGRGWLDPADHTQTARLAQPLGPYAARILQKRWKAVAGYGARMSSLTIDQRHEMRKEIKKFRYLFDVFQGLYEPDAVAHLMRQVKDLQTAFGALNDQAMAEAILSAGTGFGSRGVHGRRLFARLEELPETGGLTARPICRINAS